MSNVKDVFTTSEVAQMLDITPSHLLRLAKTMPFSDTEVRSAGKRNHLFSIEAVEKLKNRNK